MHLQRQAHSSTKMKSRRDCLGRQEFTCCNCSLSIEKPISHKRKEEEEEEERGRCSGDKQQLTRLEFMRKETLGREEGLAMIRGFLWLPVVDNLSDHALVLWSVKGDIRDKTAAPPVIINFQEWSCCVSPQQPGFSRS
ncbi:unnamed protein product [Pleuronectes platessa]|uniref:Uncharacterized protein n=1 Tax=Pleuronectes platessa TaxID=8262 RepID=A0A9N7YJL1_PLEPL|nr:unnamed protein product [Pleuronectes platessa]